MLSGDKHFQNLNQKLCQKTSKRHFKGLQSELVDVRLSVTDPDVQKSNP